MSVSVSVCLLLNVYRLFVVSYLFAKSVTACLFTDVVGRSKGEYDHSIHIHAGLIKLLRAVKVCQCRLCASPEARARLREKGKEKEKETPVRLSMLMAKLKCKDTLYDSSRHS